MGPGKHPEIYKIISSSHHLVPYVSDMSTASTRKPRRGEECKTANPNVIALHFLVCSFITKEKETFSQGKWKTKATPNDSILVRTIFSSLRMRNLSGRVLGPEVYDGS